MANLRKVPRGKGVLGNIYGDQMRK